MSLLPGFGRRRPTARQRLARELASAVDGRAVALVQGGYYLVTGVWPLVSLRSFEAVTGPKTDDWLVRTVGVLAATIGGVLTIRAIAGPRNADPLLGAASAAAFGLVDLVYAGTGRISRIYLADAAVELAFEGAWLATSRRR